MASSTGITLRPARVGTVGGYVGGRNVEVARQVRRLAGHVTVSGTAGLVVLAALARDGDLAGVDLDPAGYLQRDSPPTLFGIDWVGRQRELGLPVLRSEGRFVRRDDGAGLREAMTAPVGPDVVRVVSLEHQWLRPPRVAELTAAVRNCDEPLAFVLAAAMDPLAAGGALDGLRALLAAATDGGRRVEFLRSDVATIPLVAHGAAHGAIGTGTTVRHHSLPLGARAGRAHDARQRSPLVFVPRLLSWQYGDTLGALAPFGGAGVTGCDCAGCGGRDLLRFDRSWPTAVPATVRAEAAAHDVDSWRRLAAEVLGAADPARAWAQACDGAGRTAAALASTYRVALKVPRSVTGWV
jgi:hypothetical protein